MSNHIGLKNSNNFRSSLERLNNINYLAPYRREQLRDADAIDLGDNINHFLGERAQYPDVFSSKIKKTIIEYILPIYVDGCEVSLTQSNILISNGVVAAVDTIIKAFCPPGSLVVVLSPSFPAYSYFANINHVKFFESQLQGKDFQKINTSEIIALQPTIMFICNPNNPIGSSMYNADIEYLLANCPDTLFVIDETYQEYSSKKSDISKVPFYDNLIILKNFSKAWGLAALRIGAIVSCDKIIDALIKCIIPFSVSGLSEKEFVFTIHNNLEQIIATWQLTNLEKIRVDEQLRKNPNIKKVYESDTNYICFEVRDSNSFELNLKKSNIRIEKLDPWLVNGYRLTLGTPLENSRFITDCLIQDL